ncbi:SKICH domain-containing protein [Trichonephila clavipes]|nr:SKICH domain-containing protein [Trichonephila clavipes]
MEGSNKSSDDFSSISVVSEEWQEPCKFDYAKVIFSDLWYDANSNHVECKFQITDDLHEEPNSFVGLFPIGYNNLSECLIAKLLCECEDDRKLQCAFNLGTVPRLKDGFYQFLYVNHDNEVCGASMPLEIKQIQNHPKESLDDSLTAEKVDNDFLLVSQIPSFDNEELMDAIDKEVKCQFFIILRCLQLPYSGYRHEIFVAGEKNCYDIVLAKEEAPNKSDPGFSLKDYNEFVSRKRVSLSLIYLNINPEYRKIIENLDDPVEVTLKRNFQPDNRKAYG